MSYSLLKVMGESHGILRMGGGKDRWGYKLLCLVKMKYFTEKSIFLGWLVSAVVCFPHPCARAGAQLLTQTRAPFCHSVGWLLSAVEFSFFFSWIRFFRADIQAFWLKLIIYLTFTLSLLEKNIAVQVTVLLTVNRLHRKFREKTEEWSWREENYL